MNTVNSTLRADESRQKNVAAMGDPAGLIYSELWQELAWLYRVWAEYVALFGTKESRVDLLNAAAPAFTRIVQDAVWEGVLLNIARLTDPPRSVGKDNLSIRSLEGAITDPALKARIGASVAIALAAADFCRDWRNRHIAHRDLALSLRKGGQPLEDATRVKVKTALAAIADVLNIVCRHYFDSTTLFHLDVEVGGGPGGAMSLLHLVDAGLRAEEAARQRLERGNFDVADYEPRDL